MTDAFRLPPSLKTDISTVEFSGTYAVQDKEKNKRFDFFFKQIIDKSEYLCYPVQWKIRIAKYNGLLRPKGVHMKKGRFLSALLAAVALITSLPAAAAKEEKVLFEDDFNTLSSDYRILGGDESKVYVEDGFLYIDARGIESVRVLLPSSLNSYGNYKIEVVATMLSPSNEARWNSVMYRIQNNDYPYYQMAIRQDATAANGVEFAERTTENSWSVPAKGPFTEIISEEKMYTYTATVSGYTAVHSINGTDCVEYEALNTYKTGGIGLQANQSMMKVDSIKVTEIEDTTSKSVPCVEIAQPTTNVVGGITLSREVTSKAILDEISSAETKPANAIFNVNADGMVTDKNGNGFATLAEANNALGGVIMPTFRVTSSDAADVLITFLKEEKVKDVFVMSDDSDIVSTLRSKVKISRGVLDLSSSLADKKELSEDELLEIRGKANSCKASTVVLPPQLATQKNVKYITDRLVAVWVKQSELTKAVDAYKLVVSGVHGIISDNEKLILETIEKYMPENSLTRIPLNIGHRGLPSRTPENTIKSAQLAYEQGADVIEIDVYLTTDNEIVVMHDPTTGRMCDKDLKVENCTLAQLKELKFKDYLNSSEYADCTIPTLEEYYKEFKDKDIMIFCEIKSAKAAMITKFKELTEKYEMADQVSVITFDSSQITRLKKEYPEMSVGYLMNGIASGNTGAEMAYTVLNTIQKYGATYNPSYSGHTDEYIVNANMRSILTWPWTIDSQQTYLDFFTSGYNGITTNNCSLIKVYPKSLTSEQYVYDLENGATHTVEATVTTFDRKTANAFRNRNNTCEIIVLDGEENATLDGNKFTFTKNDCTLTYALKYTCSKYTIYSEPIVLRTGAAVVSDEETTADDSTDTPASDSVTDSGEKSTSSNMIIYIVIGVIAVAAVAVVIVLVTTKKSKKSDK